jgi:8-oxo-dGTP diphosphatase
MITCRFEDGVDTYLRHMTADVIALRDGELLLVRRAVHLIEGGKLAIPGGYMDRDETIVDTATREFREETGYAASNVRLFNLESRPHREPSGRQNVTAMFIADVDEQVGEPDAESTELCWISLAEAAGAGLAFDHGVQIELALEWLAGDQRSALVDGRKLG